ncbi:hypothetical protein AB990_15085 [Alkalihalobacillus pseudalcaliphilus]|nr:hypothetical protein AB990_15085 [Alkalihalobacillus pseudalcaliphilus]
MRSKKKYAAIKQEKEPPMRSKKKYAVMKSEKESPMRSKKKYAAMKSEKESPMRVPIFHDETRFTSLPLNMKVVFRSLTGGTSCNLMLSFVI